MRRDYDPAELDALLHDPIPVAPRRERPEPSEADDRPSDAFNRNFDHATVLGWLEFEVSHRDNQGEHWVRPGKSARDGASVTIYDDPDGPKAVVWSDTVTGWFPALEVRRPYDPYGLFVCTMFDGNFGNANRSLAEEGFGEPSEYAVALAEQDAFVEAIREDIYRVAEEVADEEHTSWWPVRGAALLKGSSDPAPDLFEREDGLFLLYRGRVNAFLGEPESAKSWAGQAALVECIQRGGDVLMVDFENNLSPVRDRMLGLGLSEYEFTTHFAYCRPDEILTADSKAYRDLMVTLEDHFDLIMVDGITDGMAMLGLNPLELMDAGKFDRLLLRPMADSGAAVVVIDHVTKSREGRGDWAIGSQHKKAAITGAMYFFEKVHDFGRGMKGMSRVVVGKDKAGYVRQHQTAEHLIAEFWLDGTVEDQVTYSLVAPTDQSQLLQASAHLMELISNYISANKGERKTTILTMCGSTASPAYLAAAFDKLRSQGYITNDLGDRNCWRTKMAFHEAGGMTDVIAGIEEELAVKRFERLRQHPAHRESVKQIEKEQKKGSPSSNGKDAGWTL